MVSGESLNFLIKILQREQIMLESLGNKTFPALSRLYLPRRWTEGGECP